MTPGNVKRVNPKKNFFDGSFFQTNLLEDKNKKRLQAHEDAKNIKIIIIV